MKARCPAGAGLKCPFGSSGPLVTERRKQASCHRLGGLRPKATGEPQSRTKTVWRAARAEGISSKSVETR